MFFFTTYTIYIIIIHMYIYFSVIVILSLNKFLIANAQLDIKKKKDFIQVALLLLKSHVLWFYFWTYSKIR